ncbi:hypothetical protein EDD11_005545 [Mortierella claussenii]|nr:hypothetical protein EDD11_005545 [Mortierella claussenii]
MAEPRGPVASEGSQIENQSPMFAATSDMDASHLFSEVHHADHSAFFSGLAQQSRTETQERRQDGIIASKAPELKSQSTQYSKELTELPQSAAGKDSSAQDTGLTVSPHFAATNTVLVQSHSLSGSSGMSQKHAEEEFSIGGHEIKSGACTMSIDSTKEVKEQVKLGARATDTNSEQLSVWPAAPQNEDVRGLFELSEPTPCMYQQQHTEQYQDQHSGVHLYHQHGERPSSRQSNRRLSDAVTINPLSDNGRKEHRLSSRAQEPEVESAHDMRYGELSASEDLPDYLQHKSFPPLSQSSSQVALLLPASNDGPHSATVIPQETPATESMGRNMFGMQDNVGQHQLLQPDVSIPFINTMGEAHSTGSEQDVTSALNARPRYGDNVAEQHGSYSFLELGNELDHSTYFSQARQSPLIREHHSRRASSALSPDLRQYQLQQAEAESSAFDQVSLTEDVPSEEPQIPHPSSKERGLASILDASTLSAMEDLLNMPKSAAFERGMTRLLKGVKSSATSIFTSPLAQFHQEPVPGAAAVEQMGRNREQNELTQTTPHSQNSEGGSGTTELADTLFIPAASPLASAAEFTDQLIKADHGLPVSSSTDLAAFEIAGSQPVVSKHLDADTQASMTHQLPPHSTSERATTDVILPATTETKGLDASILETDEPDLVHAVVRTDLGAEQLESANSQVEADLSTALSGVHSDQEIKQHNLGHPFGGADATTLGAHSGGNATDRSLPKAEDQAWLYTANSSTQVPYEILPQSAHSDLPNPEASLIQRSSSPNTLDQETFLQRQAASTLQVEQAGTTGARGAADKRQKLLEKARELLEKRQQKSGRQSPLLMKHAPISPVKVPERNAIEQPQGNGEVENERLDVQFSPAVDPSSYPTQNHTNHYDPNKQPFVAQEINDRLYSLPSLQAPASSSETAGIVAHQNNDHEHSKQDLPAPHVQINHQDDGSSSAPAGSEYHPKQYNELPKTEEKLNAASSSFPNSSAGDLLIQDDVTKERCALPADSTSMHGSDSSSANYALAEKCRYLEAELEIARRIYPELEAANAKIENLSSLAVENQQLREELIQAQQYHHKSTSDQQSATVAIDGQTYSLDQLTRETEGLRRQLKGQRLEMKELQDTVRRSETEKRDLASKIQQLERQLADLEKHRAELKSHQAMKDDAYKIIQERLVASFEEEKAMYMDEEAFKVAKLEHRCNLLQEELKVLREQDDKSKQEMEQPSTATSDAMKLQSAAYIERIAKLEADLLVSSNLLAEQQARVEEYDMGAAEFKNNEQLLKNALADMEERYQTLKQELSAVEGLQNTTSTPSGHPVHDTARLESLTEELDHALARELKLKEELDVAMQTIANTAQLSANGASDHDAAALRMEYDRLTEHASKWQEDCFAALEDKEQAESQLQIVQLDLMAARAEIGELQANMGGTGSMSLRDADAASLDTALAEVDLLRQENQEFRSVAQVREQSWSDRIADLEHQLEEQQLRCLHLEQAQNTRDIDGSTQTAEVKRLQALLDEERATGSDKIRTLEVQLERTRELLLTNQKELETQTLDLDSASYKALAAERELEVLKLNRDQSAEIIEKLQSQLQGDALREENTLTSEIRYLEEINAGLETQIQSQKSVVEQHVQEILVQKESLCKLEQDLKMALEKPQDTSSHDVAELTAQLMTLEEEKGQAQEQLELTVDLLDKLGQIPEDAADLDALKSTFVSKLTEMKSFGVATSSLSRVVDRLIEKLNAIGRARLSEVEMELQQLRSQHQNGPNDDKNESPALCESDGRDHEMEVLQQKLARAEQGVVKLQQFLQEFQNEKRTAINELQERLEDSDKEAVQLRSQLAKAQAMLLSKSPDPTCSAVEPVRGQTVQTLQPQLQESQAKRSPIHVEASPSSDDMFKGTEQVHREAVLALEPLRLQKAELERTLLDLRHRYELSQKENDRLLSDLERENQQLRAKAERKSPDVSSEHLERIHDLEVELTELRRQLMTTQREREFTRQDMRSLKAELTKLKSRSQDHAP